jgi:hypothetical protein
MDEYDDHVKKLLIHVYHHFDGPIEIQLVDAPSAVHLVLTPEPPQQNQPTEGLDMSTFGLEDNQNSDIAISFEDSAGNPVTDAIDAGSLSATSSDPASVAVTVDAGGASVLATADGALDAAVVVTVSCTVGGAAFSGTCTFDVGASAPTALTLTPGAPVANA